MVSIRSFPLERRTLLYLFAIAVLAFLPLSIYKGYQSQMGLVVAGAWFAAFSWRWPMPLVFLALALSTNLLQFASPETLPYLQVGPGIRFTAQDLTILLLLALGVARLKSRGERPRFVVPLLLLFGAIALSSAFGVVAGTTLVQRVFNGSRLYFGYLLYFGLVGVVDTPRRLRLLIFFLFALVLVTVGIQMIEGAQGKHIVISGLAGANTYWNSTVSIQVGGGRIPYLWNRATDLVYIGLFLALGIALLRSARSIHGLIAVIALFGFVIGLGRAWYIMIACGILFLLILSHGVGPRALVAVLILGVVFIIGINLLNEFIPSFPLLDAWVSRLDTLTRFQEEGTVVARVEIYSRLYDIFLDSPVLGYGVGNGFINNDVGIINTYVQLGLVGGLSVLYLIGFVFFTTLVAWRNMLPSSLRAYLAGLLALWVGMIVGYVTSLDFFGFLSISVGLAMALMDRIVVFSDSKIGTVTDRTVR